MEPGLWRAATGAHRWRAATGARRWRAASRARPAAGVPPPAPGPPLGACHHPRTSRELPSRSLPPPRPHPPSPSRGCAHLAQAGDDGCHLSGAEDARAAQRARVRHGARNVLPPHAPVKRDRVVERLHERVGGAREAAAPQLGAAAGCVGRHGAARRGGGGGGGGGARRRSGGGAHPGETSVSGPVLLCWSLKRESPELKRTSGCTTGDPVTSLIRVSESGPSR